MKAEIDAILKKYGEENAPPPWSMFTMPNAVGEGNMHVVQKVFEGSFEVGICPAECVWLQVDAYKSV